MQPWSILGDDDEEVARSCPPRFTPDSPPPQPQGRVEPSYPLGAAGFYFRFVRRVPT